MTTALYRRYRPQAFGEMIGQSQVTEPLMTALRSDRVGHAYLFSGPRGCGKTTSARILARCLNCAAGPTDTPCGTCDSCVELGRGGGGSLDVVEIDAASHNGVDDARDLRERAIFAPARDRFKIFILDEAHMVTQQGFNALLKLVEEPPAHVKFIFATTEPEKVLGTIRSRTHHYPFRLVPPAAMLEYVQELCESEGVGVEAGVLPLVVRAGGGSPRDTLSLLDQLIAGSDLDAAGHVLVRYERAVALLGYTHSELLDEVVDAFAAHDAAAAFTAVDRVVQTGQDPRRFVDDLLERLRDLIVVAATGAGASAVLRGTPDDELERMARQSGEFGPARLSRTADLVVAALDEMSGATSPRLQLELLVARVLAHAGASHGASPAAATAHEAATAPSPSAPSPAAPARAAGPAAADPRGPRIAPPGAQPAASPVAAPVASPVASPVAAPVASPGARPVASPGASPTAGSAAAVASPEEPSVGSPVAPPQGASVAEPLAEPGAIASPQTSHRTDVAAPQRHSTVNVPAEPEASRAPSERGGAPLADPAAAGPAAFAVGNDEVPPPSDDAPPLTDDDAPLPDDPHPFDLAPHEAVDRKGAQGRSEAAEGARPHGASAAPAHVAPAGRIVESTPPLQPSPPTPPATPSGPIELSQVRDAWTEVLAQLEARSRPSWLIVSSATVAAFADDVLTLTFRTPGDLAAFKNRVDGGGPSEDLRQAIQTVLGIRVKYLARLDGDAGPGGPGGSGAAPGRGPSADGAPAPAPGGADPARPSSAPRAATGYAAAPVTEWAVAPIPRSEGAVGSAPVAAAATIAPASALAVDDEPDDAALGPAVPAPVREGAVLPAADVTPSVAAPDEVDDDDVIPPVDEQSAPVPPVVVPRMAPLRGGVQRYGEAVVRQVLGATYVRDEPYEPPTRFT